MTVQEFKQQHPEHSELEGDNLWNAMEDCMLEQQQGGEIIRSAGNFFQRYKLRKLFYWNGRSIPFVEPHQSSNRCSSCKRGVSYRMVFLNTGDIEDTESPCPYCRKPYKPEPNTNLSYRWYKFTAKIESLLRRFLNWSCIAGSNSDKRYGVFGDERQYVQYWLIKETGKVKCTFRHRRWWEYIFVKR